MGRTLYHATSWREAQQISRERRFRCGNHGFAGGGIYFSSTPQAACRKCKNGRGPADIIVECDVSLGRMADVEKHTVDGRWCRDNGYDSVKIDGFDVYAVYDHRKVTILGFRRPHSGETFDSMDDLENQNSSRYHLPGLVAPLPTQQQPQYAYGISSSYQPPDYMRQQGQPHSQSHLPRLVHHTNNASTAPPYNSSARQVHFQGRQSQPPSNYSQLQGGPREECCFPAHATVELKDGRKLMISNLKVGDHVATQRGDGTKVFSEVYAFGHADMEATSTFQVLTLENGNELDITGAHLLPIHDESAAQGRRFVLAMDILVGDTLITWTGLSRVTNTKAVVKAGLYAPFTLEGTILVDGVLASCYAVLRSHELCHLAMAPLRAAHRSGITSLMEVAAMSQGSRLKGAHPYIDLLSYTLPLVRALGL